MPLGFSAQQNEAPYDLYSASIGYGWTSGKLQMPVAAPVGSGARTACELVRVHQACGVKTVTWVAERRGTWPEVPAPEPDTTTQCLRSAAVTPSVPSLADDAVTRIYRITGTYTYLLLTPTYPADGLPTGAFPYETETLGMHIVPSSTFTQNVIGAGSTQPTPPLQLG